MKTLHMAVFTLISMLCLGSVTMAADLGDGFMGYTWGEDISRYEELKMLKSQGEVSYFRNPGEAYSINDIAIKNVVFGFYQDSLFAVYVAIDTLESYDQILMHLKRKYGFPKSKTSASQYLGTFQWKYKDVTIKLKTDEIGGKMKLGFYYKPLSKELNAGQLDLSDQSSYKFFPIDKNKQPRMVPFLEF